MGNASVGHEIPERKSRITDIKTNIIIGDSRVRIKPEIVMDIKMHAKR